jgi:hypothetical protein
VGHCNCAVPHCSSDHCRYCRFLPEGPVRYCDAFRQDYLYATTLDYFADITFTPPEYGDGGTIIYKWDRDLRINITGEPEYSDIDAVLSAIDDLNGLTGNISLSLNDSDANVIVYVGSGRPILDYLETNDTNLSNGGFFFWTRNDTAVVDRATIAISNDYYSASLRAYNLRYALVYVLGLHGVSPAYNDSIFYTHYTPVSHYSALDQALVRMLYDDRLTAGMTKEEALAALGTDR